MAIDMIKAELSSAHDEPRAAAAEYVSIAAQKLAEARHPMSTRRAVQIVGNNAAIDAVYRREAAPANESTAALLTGAGQPTRRRPE